MNEHVFVRLGGEEVDRDITQIYTSHARILKTIKLRRCIK